MTFNKFNGSNLSVLDSFYSKDIFFKDPLHEVRGLGPLKKYYEKLYKQVDFIQFQFHEFIQSENAIVGVWTMTVKIKNLNGGEAYNVRGSSIFRWDTAGLITEHQDYFDVGEMLYEKIFGIGIVIKKIKNTI